MINKENFKLNKYLQSLKLGNSIKKFVVANSMNDEINSSVTILSDGYLVAFNIYNQSDLYDVATVKFDLNDNIVKYVQK